MEWASIFRQETALYMMSVDFLFFAFLVDHPIYHRGRLKSNVQNLIVSCIDKTHVEFINEYENIVCSKVFIPHGARRYTEPRPFSQRTYRFIFAGSYSNPDHVRKQWQGFDSHLARFLDNAAERALYDSERTLPDIFQELLNEKGLDENPIYLRKLTEVMPLVDRFVRSKRRLMVLEALTDFPLHVFGNGWDECPLYGRNQWVFHPPVSYNEMQELMGDSQMVLSVLPYFQFGGHERIFSAMLAGAVLLTDTNAYLNQNFRPDKDFVPYSLTEPDRLRQQVGALFDDPVLLEEMAESGREAIMRGHLWKHRTEQIVEAVKFHYTFYPLHM
jgi:hypothetical protein